MQLDQGSQTVKTSQKAFLNTTGQTSHCFLFVSILSIPTTKVIHQYTLCRPHYKSTGIHMQHKNLNVLATASQIARELTSLDG